MSHPGWLYRGMHGTAYSHALSIQREGFRVSKSGRVGAGVYFWAYIEDKSEARALAIGWWRDVERRGDYHRCRDKRCTVLDVEIELQEEEVLDLTRLDLQEAFRRILLHMEENDIDITKENEVSKVFDSFVSSLERKQNQTFHMLQACLPQPKRAQYQIGKFLGNPTCYIVRNPDFIRIQNVETHFSVEK